MLRSKRSQFLQADWFSRCGETRRTTLEIDELNVAYNTKAGNSYCSLSPAYPFSYRQALACPEELLKRRRRTRSLRVLAIGSQGAHRQARFQLTLVRTAGAIGTRIVQSVRQWPERLGHRAH